MGLLNPILLALGLAAAVPLLLHLLQRQQGVRVAFPALRYLRRAEKESARRIRVRQILLMMLRIAAVLLIAFAAARPFTRAGGAGHSPTAAVIILDNGLSSGVIDGDARIIDALKARALELLELAGPEDRFWLLRAGDAGTPALPGDAETTAQRVRDVQPAGASVDLGTALQHAAALLAAGADGRAAEIHLLSDLRVRSFTAPVSAAAGAPPVVVWHPGGEPPPNRAVADVEVGGGLAALAGERTTLTATIAGDGDDTVSVRLVVDERLVAAARATPGATAVLSLPPRGPGIVTGRVEIDADALHADDVRHFVARVLPPRAVAMAGDAPFIGDALEVLVEAGRVRRTGAAGADVVIMPAALGLESAGATTATVVLPPVEPVEIAAVNRRLAAAGIPWRYAPPAAGETRFAEVTAAAGAERTGPEAADPLLRALHNVRLRLTYPLQHESPAPGETVLLRLADGQPWAVRGERTDGGIYVLLGSPLTAEASTVPTSAAMLPLLDRLTAAWSLAQPPRTDLHAGAAIDVPADATAVQLPDGTREPVAPGTYRLGAQPGVYRVLRADSVIAAYAVNAPAAASDLARLDRRGLGDRLPGWSLHVTSDAAAYHRAAFRERLGRELWRPLLFALLAVLVVETLVAAAGGAPSTAAPMPTSQEAETA
jgi:hypothetical protein